jgi:hypothetical protein
LQRDHAVANSREEPFSCDGIGNLTGILFKPLHILEQNV